jgi:hypothetical protein
MHGQRTDERALTDYLVRARSSAVGVGGEPTVTSLPRRFPRPCAQCPPRSRTSTYVVVMNAAMGELSDWYESKRLMVNPLTHIDTLRLLILEDDDPLLLADHDEITDPRSLTVASAQQRRGGQRRRRLERLTRAGRHGSAQDSSQ